jgi:hypothetical protein
VTALTGDFSKLASWSNRIGNVRHVPEKVASEVAPQLKAEVEKTFATETSPDGAPWAPDKPATYRLGTRSILDRSGAMRGGITITATGSKTRIDVAASYYRYQRGRRDPIPTKGKLPPSWSSALKKTSLSSIRQALGV